MELKQLIGILNKGKGLYLGLTASILALTFVWQVSQPVVYEANLLLNIGRSGVSQASDYTYDSFYRLQADERFADTVVRWLEAPRIALDITNEAKKNGAVFRDNETSYISFTSARLSSQAISVTYRGDSAEELELLSKSLVAVLNRYTEGLNTGEHEKSWFVVLGSDPVITDSRVTLPIALTVALLVGLFVSFWAVLIRHYFSR